MNILITIATALAVALVLAFVSIVLYQSVNAGLSSSAIHQQTTRLSLASVIAVLPRAVCGFGDMTLQSAAIIVVCVAWAVTYPSVTYITNRRTSPEIDNYMDIAFALYMAGFLSALHFVGGYVAAAAISVIEAVMLLIVVAQWAYYVMYKGGIDTNGMRIVRDTNVNEVIEFTRYYPVGAAIAIVLTLLIMAAAPFVVNFTDVPAVGLPLWSLLSMIVYMSAVFILMFAGRRSPWRRCGIVEMYGRVSEYRKSNLRYKAEAGRRRQSLEISRRGEALHRPSTVLLVIGESATRDYMKAFNDDVDRDTTPRLTAARRDSGSGFLFFDNAYSCDMHTVQVLEKSLTAANQYNGKDFVTSTSIIDIARALGYKVHWYSNQGHIGVYDTPVTLVAETSDVAKWTRQDVGKIQYDHTLLDFMSELDPAVDNLLVLHLKGSHFSYLNRYPADRTVWGEPGVQDNVLNYMNSLHYTDSVIGEAFDYCRRNLNLDVMIYFSDHGSVPERHRSPLFDGYGNTRIPLCIWASDEYRAAHRERFDALAANTRRHWTNDLLYDLLLGVLDVVPCAHYDPSASLADMSYAYTADDLLTFSGRLRIADDKEPIPFRHPR